MNTNSNSELLGDNGRQLHYGQISRPLSESDLFVKEKVDLFQKQGSSIINKEYTVDSWNCKPILAAVDWATNSPSFSGNGLLGLGVLGPTGSGKTTFLKTLNALSKQLSSNFSQYFNNGFERIPLEFEITSTWDIVKAYEKKGLDGLTKYEDRSILAVDDLGAEPVSVRSTNTSIDVLPYLIMRRHARNKFVLFNSALSFDQLNKKYGESISSRLSEMVNFLDLGEINRRQAPIFLNSIQGHS